MQGHSGRKAVVDTWDTYLSLPVAPPVSQASSLLLWGQDRPA